MRTANRTCLAPRKVVGRWPLWWLDETGRNLRQAARRLRQSPVFTLVAVLTLALCIGVNTAIFSVVDSLILRPLPYPQSDRLANVAIEINAGSVREIQISHGSGLAYRVLRAHASTLDCAAFSGNSTGINLLVGGTPEYVRQQRVSAGFFRVLGVRPLLGREFSLQEDQPGGAAVAILSYSLWRRHFHRDAAVLGHTIVVGGEAHGIIGIMPEGYEREFGTDLWKPLRPAAEVGNYEIVARLRPRKTWHEADAQVQSLAGAALADLPRENTTLGLRVVPLQRDPARKLRTPLLLLLAAVAVVLLIGCLNVASLLLARAGRRRREIATRLALGGGRMAMVRQLMCESLLLGTLGGAVGLVVAQVGLESVRQLAKASLFDVLEGQVVGMDVRTLAATGCISLLTSIVFGLVPTLKLSATDLRSTFNAPGGHGAIRSVRRWPRHLLVVTEVALGVALAIAAGLLMRSLSYLWNLAPGFDGTNVVAARVSLQDTGYASSRRVNQLFAAGLARIHEIPGVQATAVSLGLPYERMIRVVFTWVEDGGLRNEGDLPLITGLVYVTPEYFSTLRIPLLRGRGFSDHDRPNSPQVVIVNRSFVQKYTPDPTTVGQHLKLMGVKREIVGIAGDVLQQTGLSPYGPLEPTPVVYIPAMQGSDDFFRLVHLLGSPAWIVRTLGTWETTAASMQEAVRSVDPSLPLHGFATMAEARSRSLAAHRFQAILLGTLAGVALLLAAIGLFGLIAQSLAERRHEMGIRLALGATTVQAIVTVACPGIALTLLGVSIGMLLARVGAKVMAHLISGVTVSDPITYSTSVALFVLVSIFASVIPALRLTEIDIVDSLRSE
jgi:predicted permease